MTQHQKNTVLEAAKRWPIGRSYYQTMATNQHQPPRVQPNGLKIYDRLDCLEVGCPAAALAATRTTGEVTSLDIMRAMRDIEDMIGTQWWWRWIGSHKGQPELIKRLERAAA